MKPNKSINSSFINSMSKIVCWSKNELSISSIHTWTQNLIQKAPLNQLSLSLSLYGDEEEESIIPCWNEAFPQQFIQKSTLQMLQTCHHPLNLPLFPLLLHHHPPQTLRHFHHHHLPLQTLPRSHGGKSPRFLRPR